MRVLLFIFVLFANILSQAQNIKGRIVDDNHQPLPFANVEVLSIPDSTFLAGVVSKESGDFLIEKIYEEKYILRISYLGYETVERVNPSGDMGQIILNPSSIILKEAMVTAHRPVYKLKGNTLIANVKNSILGSVGALSDVLKRLPGIRMDKDEIEVFGKGKPLIYINNRQIQDMAELKQLKSSDIEKVEVINNPGAEYDASIQAVVKIKTIQPVGEGLGGRMGVNGSYMDMWLHEENVNMNYRHGALDLFGSVEFQENGQKGLGDTDLTIYADTIWNFKADSKSWRKTHNISGKLGANYIFDDWNSIGVSYLVFRTPKSEMDVLGKENVLSDNKYYDQLASDSYSNTQSATHRINTYYNGKIAGKLGIDFNFDFLYGKNDGRQTVDEQSEDQKSRWVNSFSSASNYLYASKLMFTYSLPVGMLRVGGEYNNIRRNDSYQNEQQIVPGAVTESKEEKAAAFLSYEFSVNSFHVQAGARYEHAAFDYYHNQIKQNEKCHIYNNVYPSVDLSFPVNKMQMSLSYTAKTQRPSFSQLDGNIEYQSRFMYRGGNPLLKPQLIHNVNWMSLYKYIQFSVNYIYVKDLIMSIREQYESQTSVTFRTFRNFNHFQELGMSFSLSPTLAFWHPYFNAYFSQPFFSVPYLEAKKKCNNPLFRLSLYNELALPKSFILSLDLDFTSAGDVNNDRVMSTGGVDLGIRRTFLKNALDVNLRGMDIFKTRRFNVISYYGQTRQVSHNTSTSRGVRLTVTYYFNPSKSKYKGRGAANEDLKRL